MLSSKKLRRIADVEACCQRKTHTVYIVYIDRYVWMGLCVCVFGCHANSRWVLIKMYVSWAHFVSKRSPQFHGPPMPRKVYECDLRRIYCWQHGANFVCQKEGRESGKRGKQSTSNCFLFLQDFSIYNGLFMAWCLHCASRAIADCVWRISPFLCLLKERERGV